MIKKRENRFNWYKRICLSLVLLGSCFFMIPTSVTWATPKISADAAVLMDAQTGQIYYAKNGDKQRSPASLTKIMTGILAIELGDKKDVVTVGKNAQKIYVGQQINLKAGEKITLENLLKAALMFSANDSTVAIAEHISGNQADFVDLMNKKALALGAYNTHFVNTNGYSVPNHYSTASDLALITRYALKNKTFAKIVSTKEDTIYWTDDDRKKEIRSTNRLLKNNYPGVNGVKTGTTIRAGNCLIVSAARENRQLIAVVLHSKDRYKDGSALLEYGFDNLVKERVVEKGEKLAEVAVNNGFRNTISLVAAKDIIITLPKDEGDVFLSLKVKDPVQAPVSKGQSMGKLIISSANGVIGQVDLVAAEEVWQKKSIKHFWQRIFS